MGIISGKIRSPNFFTISTKVAAAICRLSLFELAKQLSNTLNKVGRISLSVFGVFGIQTEEVELREAPELFHSMPQVKRTSRMGGSSR